MQRVRIMHDVLEDLNELLTKQMRPGTADSDVNVFAIEYPVPYGLLIRLHDEIVKLRQGKT